MRGGVKARELDMSGQNGRKKRKYFMCFVVLWLLQMSAAFWFCTQKQGFHEDEFYTYYSTARTNGFYVEDGKWMERDEYRNEFVVLPGERFQYGLVKQVQSWDVHPPMYYWAFHTVASLVPGVFSKWIGLSVNLFFHGMNLILLAYLSYLASGRDEQLPLFAVFVYGFSPAAMSGVVFIRMYEMLTAFMLLCAILHVREAARRQDGSGRQCAVRLPLRTLLAMAVVTYVGFLTQYYYFIFLFFMATAFCIWLLWRDRNIWNCLRYGVFQGLAFALAYLTYPAIPGQMFKGQRGAQATENFFNLSNTLERLTFFWDLMNRYVFGGLLGLMLLFLVAAAAAVRPQNRRGRHVGAEETENAQNGRSGEETVFSGAAFYMLLFAAAGYFLAVSKTALLLGGTSNRYQLPIYGILTLLLALGTVKVFRQAAGMRHEEGENREKAAVLPVCAAWYKKRMTGVAAAFCLAAVALSYVRADVEFLYPEAAEAVALARDQADAQIPAVYIYKPGEEWCIWAVADELMQHDSVYFVSAADEAPIMEPSIAAADAVVIYTPLYDDVKDEEAQYLRVSSGNGKLSEGYLQHLHKFCAEWYGCGSGGAWSGGEQP